MYTINLSFQKSKNMLSILNIQGEKGKNYKLREEKKLILHFGAQKFLFSKILKYAF